MGDEEGAGVNGHGTPFLLNGRKSAVGIVLVHGYLSCPEQMRPLAERLHDAGYNVYVVRLDGHGRAGEPHDGSVGALGRVDRAWVAR